MKIGILGAGQLAMMLAQAAEKIEVDTLCFTDQENSPASFHSKIFQGDLDSKKDLEHFANQVDVITLENEFINKKVIEFIKKIKPTYPDEHALSITQDRLLEKHLFQKLGIPCADFSEINSPEDLKKNSKKFTHQAILKTRRLGYDGKGQYVILGKNDIPLLENMESNFILERMVPFDFEVSIIAARNVSGDTCFYPLTHNEHKGGILRKSTAPYVDEVLQKQAEAYALSIMTHFNYVGVITVEFFVINNTLFANEIAPRVHNSGHWTIEGSCTSQFENHLRAVCNLKLGNTISTPSVMHNIIGEMPHPMPEGTLHDYHKAPRPGRKLGHVTNVKA